MKVMTNTNTVILIIILIISGATTMDTTTFEVLKLYYIAKQYYLP